MIKRALLLFLFFACLTSAVGLFVLFQALSLQPPDSAPTSAPVFWSLSVNGKPLRSQVVTSTEDITRGLGGHDPLADDEGMLFVFDQPGVYAFWMKGMRFPIDIVWVDHGKVVDIAPNMPPPASAFDWPKTYRPKASADMVLEVAAGRAEAYGLRIGSEIVPR